jgi:hypothetical protein
MLEPWAWRHRRWKKWPWYHLFERRHLDGASRVLTTSEKEAENVRKRLPAVDCRALPLGLTSEREPDYMAARRKLGWSESDVVLLFLSRIHPKKGLDLLLRALAALEPGSSQIGPSGRSRTESPIGFPGSTGSAKSGETTSGPISRAPTSSACLPIPRTSASRFSKPCRWEPVC